MAFFCRNCLRVIENDDDGSILVIGNHANTQVNVSFIPLPEIDKIEYMYAHACIVYMYIYLSLIHI